MKPVYTFSQGTTAVLISIPHAGVYVTDEINDCLTAEVRHLPDTDWYVDRLYRRMAKLGAGLLVANYSRYVIDLNRPPDDSALYAGAGTGLLPLQTFDGVSLYRQGLQPGQDEAKSRMTRYWLPYHQKLNNELKRLKQCFGHAVLLDAHSILSRVPRLFDGRLPDLNLGSYNGVSADSRLLYSSMTVLEKDTGFSTVLDGRFKGGFITRHYGCPRQAIHALQLEIAQSAYMNEDPPTYNEQLAGRLLPVLEQLVDNLIAWKPADE